MVAVAVAAILAVLAEPSFNSLMLQLRTTAIANALFSDLNLARSEAIKRNTRVLMCIANSAQTDCASASSDWSVGWLICVNVDKSGSCDNITSSSDINYPNPFIRRSAIPGGLSLVGKPGTTTNLIKFNSDGSAVAAELDLTGNQKRCLNVANTGGVQLNPANTTC